MFGIRSLAYSANNVNTHEGTKANSFRLKINGKFVVTFVAIALFIAMICVCSFIGDNQLSEVVQKDPNQIRLETLEQLEHSAGSYDEQSIVLSNTSHSEAKKFADRLGGRLRITENGKFATITLSEGTTVLDIYSNESNNDIMLSILPDYSAAVSEVVAEDEYVRPTASPNYTVADTLYSWQSYLDYLNLGDVWKKYNGSDITVAVIDTGIDTDHPEFEGKISEYSYNASEDKIVKDYTASDGGYDWSLIEDEQGHGTMVAGTIAASMDGVGTIGVAPNVTLIVIKAECNAEGQFLRGSDLVFGLYYAIERDVDVVNMSFGVISTTNAYEEAAQLGADSDVLMVAAAGNASTANLTYPAADPNVIGVGALENNGWELATYSNYGENTDLVAPGSVFTTTNNGEYGSTQGTSFASPIVAAALALLKNNSTYKYYENKQIEELLYASCYDLGDLGKDWYFGYGALDINALCQEERGTITFDMLTEELDNTTQVFIRNHTLQNMPEPERLYAVFDGWYYDIHCTEEYNWYSDVFVGDLTLYANWVNEDDGVPYTYVILEDGTIEIRSYTGRRRYITIPDMIEGRKVTSIGEFAFQNQSKLRQVELPKYLERIRQGAFNGCNNLVSIALPQSVKEIGDSAFENAVRLSSVQIPENSSLINIGNFAFAYTGLRAIDLPESLASINGSAFLGATSMLNINIDRDNKNFLSNSGVLYTKSMSSLVAYPAGRSGSFDMPATTEQVGYYAFAYSKINTISLNNVTSIGVCGFFGSNLLSVELSDKVESVGVSAFAYNFYLSSVIIENGIKEIPEQCFAYNFELRTITIPASIQLIDLGAFSAAGLQEVNFDDNSELHTINSKAFENCPIEEIILPKNLIVIGSEAFANCKVLSNVTFHENSVLRVIGASAFSKTYSLDSISFPSGLQAIGSYAFLESGITGRIALSKNVYVLGVGAFAACHELVGIDVAEDSDYYASYDGVVYNEQSTEIVAYPAGIDETDYTIRSGVEKVGDAAFYGAWNLESINVPDGVTEIGEYAFYDCQGVTAYSLPTSLENIEMYAFANNFALQSISIPDAVKHIGQYAFNATQKLTTIQFNDTSELDRIGFAAFSGSGITSFRVPSNVSTIAQYAFSGCDKLTSITFAKNSKLPSISAYQFDGCNNLQSIVFEEGSALTQVQAHGLEGMKMLQTVDFGGAQVIEIDNFAFRFCESLTTLTVPSTLVNIGRFAFYYATSFSSISLPIGIEHIGRYAFLGTDNCNVYFESESLPMYLDENWDYGVGGYYTGVSNVKTTDDGKYKYAVLSDETRAVIEYLGEETQIDLTMVDFGGDLVNIGGYAFYNKDIESVVLPDSVRQIQRYAFAANLNLAEITIPASTNYIAGYAFYNTGIESLNFAGDNVAIIEQYAFAQTKQLESVVIPASVTRIGEYTFYNSGIKALTFEENCSLTKIPKYAFAKTKLTSVAIPESIQTIDSSAFRDAVSLAEVDISGAEGLIIYDNVFYNTGLTSVHIPANVEYIGEYAFVGLTKLSGFTVDENNLYYSAEDGVLFNKSATKLIAFPAGREGEYTVSNKVEIIGFGAFENTKLSKVTFEDGINLLTLGYRAFYNADALTSIAIPASVVSIDYYAFAQCDSLETVELDENSALKGIYEGAFYSCVRLENITIPDSILEISDYAFYGCTSLTSLPVTDSTQLLGIYSYAFAYAGIEELYLPATLIDIDEYAFSGIQITELRIPSENKLDLMIGIGAFANCNKIESITVPFIGASFEDVDISWFGHIFGAGGYEANSTYVPESLKHITIDEGITFVGTGAFYGLADVETLDMPTTVDTVYAYALTNTTMLYEYSNPIRLLTAKGELVTSAGANYLGEGISGPLELQEGVTGIGSSAFSNRRNLTSIDIPDSVTSIGNGAFSGCSSLTNINIPEGVTSIGNSTFSSCSSLTSIEIPEGVTSIGSHTFQNCSSLTNINIPAGVTSIGDSTFSSCSSLTIIDIPNGVTSISQSAFRGCRSLTSIDIPNGVTSIGDSAFSYCSSLTSIEIPEGVTSIGSSAFQNCSILYEVINHSSLSITLGGTDYGYVAYYAKVVVDKDGNKTYKNGEFTYVDTADGFRFGLENDVYTLYTYLGADETIVLPESINGSSYQIYKFILGVATSVTIPEGVTSIGSSAFQGCSSLTGIDISNSVTSIGSYAFDGCSSLTSIDIPDSVTSIGSYAFRGCSSLTSIDIPNGVTSLYAGFQGCTKLIDVTFGKNSQLMSIEFSAFSGCSSLTSVMFGENSQLKSIGARAFYCCSSLMSIVIPDSVKTIYADAFSGCGSINFVLGENTDFVYENSILWTKDYATLVYINVNSVEVILPEGITVVSNWLKDNTSVQRVIIPNGARSISSSAFSGCSSLISVDIPESVTSIGSSAFSGCSSLISVDIPEGVTSIDNVTFSGCSSLISIDIPEGVTSISQSAFSGCRSLTGIDIPEGVTSIGSSAFEGCSSLFSIEIPDGVTSIGLYTFKNCSSLTSIQIPDSLTSIDGSAFYNCSSLVSIDIPEGVMSIGDNAFYNCSSLVSIDIPEGVTSIGSATFYYCSSLVSIGIPKGVTSIDSAVFSSCRSLMNVYFAGNLADWCEIIFEKSSSNPTCFADNLYIEGKLIAGELVISEGVTSISNYAFYNYNNFTSVIIPESTTSVGSSAFQNCSHLYEVVNHSSLSITLGGTDNGYVAYYAKVVVDKDGNKTYKNGEFTHVDTADDFRFGLENNVYTLYAYLGVDDSIILPEAINGEAYQIYYFKLGNANNVTIPNGVTSIGNNAFYNCSSLISIDIPDSVTSIGSAAFFGCSSLTSIDIPEGVTSIGVAAFNGCSSLTNIDIPEGVTSIGNSTFNGCSSLISIDIPEGVTSIGSTAFYGCSSLTNIYLPEGVTGIGNSAFAGCTAYYDNSDNWDGGYLFAGNAVIDVDPELVYATTNRKITCVAQDAFNNCYLLKQAIINGSVSRSYNPLSSTTNIETLVLNEIPSSYLYYAWGATASKVPTTLKRVVISADCKLVHKSLFEGISGISIYVDRLEEDCMWDDNFPNWNNGNPVFYADEWNQAIWHDSAGQIVAVDYYSSNEIVRPPHIMVPESGEQAFKFDGWDFDGDGVIDSIPATIVGDLDATAIVSSREAQYSVEFLDKDGVMVIWSYLSKYNEEVTLPETPQKKGYTFVGWQDYEDGMLVTKDVTFYSIWSHEGDGHDYSSTLVPSNCSEDGYTLHTCIICDEFYKSDFVDATGHTFGDWDVTVEPTCSIEGEKRRVCSCGHEEIVEIERNSHKYKVTVTKTPNCTELGEKTYECRNCGDKYTEIISQRGHSYGKRTTSAHAFEAYFGEFSDIFYGYEGESVFYYECDECRECMSFDEGELIGVASALSQCAHAVCGDWEVAVQPSCVDGLEVRKCLECGDTVQARTVPANGIHIFDEWYVVTEPTCTTEGVIRKDCIYCDHCETGEISISIHDLIPHDSKAPTCTEIGWDTYVTCSRCDYTTYVEIPALDHDLVEHDAKTPTCTEIGWNAYETCSRCEYTTYVEIVANGHTEAEMVVENNVAPSCTVAGHYDNVVYCSVCDIELDRETIIVSALGHDAIPHDSKAPTCTEIGWNVYVTCSRCDYTTYVEIPALDHDIVEHTAQAPTCTEIGWNTYETCSRCEYTTYAEIPAIGHDLIPHDSKAVTCTNIGWDTYVTCSRCEYTTYEEIPALDHDIVEHNAQAPTCTEIGWNAYEVCSRCEHNTYKELAALGHSFADTGACSRCEYQEFAFTVNGSELTLSGVGKDFNGITAVIPGEFNGKPVTTIASNAFNSCTNLRSVTIPSSVASVSTAAMNKCSNLTEILVDVNSNYYKSVDGVLYSKDGKKIVKYPGGKTGTSYEIIAGVTSIEGNAFYQCTKLTNIRLPDTLTSFGMSSFSGCSSLVNIVIPSGVTSLGWSSFSSCSGLENVYYMGTEEQWNGISQSIGNSNLTNATRYYYSECVFETNQWRYDSNGNISTTVTVGAWIVDCEPTCTANGIKHRICSACDRHFMETIPTNGHTEAEVTVENNVAPSCTVAGHYDNVVYCSVCDVELDRETITIDALDHDLVEHDAKTPTCTEIGWNAYETCSRCEYTTYAEIPANGHTEAEVVVENNVAPSCTVAGSYDNVVYCSTCDAELSREEVIVSALGHDAIPHDSKAPTCTEIGWNVYVTCSRCDYTTYAEIPALDHDIVEHNAKTPTCTEIGWNAYETCSRCEYTTYVEIVANGHTEAEVVVENNVAPSCTVAGSYDNVVYCSTCDAELSREEVIVSALGHDAIPHDSKAPTCTEIGWNVYVTCSRCDYTTYAEIPALEHDIVEHNAQAPTCTEIGWNAYETCSRCDYTTYAEIPANGHTESEVVVENNVAPSCTVAGSYDNVVYCSTCDAELSREEVTVSALGHDAIPHDSKAPTCTEIGWNAYVTCSRCDYTTYAEIPALDHDIVEHTAQAPTCTEIGWSTYVTCSRCDYTTYAEINALDHDIVEHNAQTPTCTEIGWNAYETCSRCEYTTYAEIPAIGHDLIPHDSKAVTCTNIGWDTYVTCSRCEYTTYEEIPALDHDIVEHDAKTPTCTEIGWNAYETCSRCEYTTYAEIPANGHTESEVVVENNVAPSCTVAGHYDNVVYCSVCDIELDRETITIDALDHDLVEHDAKTPTCTEIGWNAYETCSRCEYTTYAEIPANGHTESEVVVENNVVPTCSVVGSYDNVVYCSVCDIELDRETITVSALGHDAIPHDSKAPTCTEIGWNVYVTCSRCDYTTYAEIPALGHDIVEHNAKTPTCTEIGWDTYVTCSRCDYTTYAEIPANGHTESEVVVENNVVPTCTVVGSYDNVVYCSVCDIELDRETITIDALGHDIVEHAAQEPTFENIGWDAYETCSRCDYTTYTEISALGHDLIPHDSKAPTCTEIGWSTYVTCSRCDYTTYAEIPALGHDEVHHEAQVATCSQPGWNAHVTCSRCDYSTCVETPKLAHVYGEWVVIEKPDNDNVGQERRDCDTCEHYETREIAPIGYLKEFKESIANLSSGQTAKATYAELYDALQLYAKLTAEEKQEANNEFIILQSAIKTYNEKAVIANEEMEEATEVAFIPVSISFAFLAILWFLIKRKFWIK